MVIKNVAVVDDIVIYFKAFDMASVQGTDYVENFNLVPKDLDWILRNYLGDNNVMEEVENVIIKQVVVVVVQKDTTGIVNGNGIDIEVMVELVVVFTNHKVNGNLNVFELDEVLVEMDVPVIVDGKV